MSGSGSLPSHLRAEARLLSLAGLQALAIAFPFTLFLVTLALGGSAPPLAPVVFGGPLLLLGYVPCHLATLRLSRARAMEGLR